MKQMVNRRSTRRRVSGCEAPPARLPSAACGWRLGRSPGRSPVVPGTSRAAARAWLGRDRRPRRCCSERDASPLALRLRKAALRVGPASSAGSRPPRPPPLLAQRLDLPRPTPCCRSSASIMRGRVGRAGHAARAHQRGEGQIVDEPELARRASVASRTSRSAPARRRRRSTSQRLRGRVREVAGGDAPARWSRREAAGGSRRQSRRSAIPYFASLIPSTPTSMEATLPRISSSILVAISGFDLRKSRAFSRPWPSRVSP